MNEGQRTGGSSPADDALAMETRHLAGLPQLDIHTLSEDWALMTALQNHWGLLARAVGLPPSRWLDRQGDRMYGAVMALSTRFDLADPVREDDEVEASTAFVSVRKPHALSRTRFLVEGAARAEATLLTSFIKRRERGSNKKFAKVRDLWTGEDRDGDRVDALLDRHHAVKSAAAAEAPDPDAEGPVALVHEANRIRDFNAADFLYFKTYVAIAKAAEWRENRGRPSRLNASREAWYFGNVEDGEEVVARVRRDGDAVRTTLRAASDGRLLLVSDAIAPEVVLATR